MGNSITPNSEVLPKMSGLGGLDTIPFPVGSSGVSSFISVFVLFILLKDCWILFRLANSACCFYHDTITRMVTLLCSERAIYPPSLKDGYPTSDSQPGICLHYMVKIYIYIIYIYIYIYIYICLYLYSYGNQVVGIQHVFFSYLRS